MKLTIILGMDENGGIGYQNQMPWHLPADLKHFKSLTMGKPILMGRRTYISIGRPLPGRRNVVITRNRNFVSPDLEIYHSPEEALTALADQPEVMLIGGADLIKQLMPKADRMYLTRIHSSFKVDIYCPEWSKHEWKLIAAEKHTADEKNLYAYTFFIYERLRS